jgi:hypothetical protein
MIPSTSVEPDRRFEALVRERDSLRVEVAEMRRSLEQIKSKHDEEMNILQHKLEETKNEKEHAEGQFRNLLGKVNTIKAQLGERLKADAVCKTIRKYLSLNINLVDRRSWRRPGPKSRSLRIKVRLLRLK